METTYPWLESSDAPLNPPKPAERPQPTRRDKAREFLRSSLPWLALMAVVLALSVFARKPAAPTLPPAPAVVDVVAPLVPIGRGRPILADQLRLLPLARRDLSKAQLLKIVRDEDLAKFQGRIVAKRLLPPGRPLFWSDLEWKSETSAQAVPQILYPAKD
jgi:hypothetical protein